MAALLTDNSTGTRELVNRAHIVRAMLVQDEDTGKWRLRAQLVTGE